MESHQNLHTYAVDSDIQLKGNNRVLKYNDALSHNYGQGTVIYCRTTSIWC